MNAWISLTKKEFKLGLPAFLIALILFVGVIGAGYFAGNHLGYQGELLTVAFGIVLTLHMFFLTFYLFYSLNSERKRLHLWLHTPMSIAGLLSSKLFTGIVFMVSTFVVSTILSTSIFSSTFDFLNQETIFNLIGISTISVFVLAIFLATNFLFFWSVFLTFSQRMNDFFSFILTVVLFFIISWGYQSFVDLSFIQTLTNWGSIQVDDLIVGFEFSFMNEEFEGTTISEQTILYFGNFVRDIILAVILFIAACWIIDKKVEV